MHTLMLLSTQDCRVELEANEDLLTELTLYPSLKKFVFQWLISRSFKSNFNKAENVIQPQDDEKD